MNWLKCIIFGHCWSFVSKVDRLYDLVECERCHNRTVQ